MINSSVFSDYNGLKKLKSSMLLLAMKEIVLRNSVNFDLNPVADFV